MRRRLLVAAAALALGGAVALPGDAAPAPRTSYVVTLVGGSAAPAAVAQRAAALGGDVGFVYDTALRGFSVRLPAAALPALQRLPGVATVEPDQVVHADYGVESNPPSYGLDRIDQRDLPLNAQYVYERSGTGVTAYVIDTGIRTSHTDFGGRAVTGVDVVDGGPADDCNGHGTHVAGTLGGRSFGVAKGVRLVAVRVLGCDGSGSTSGVIAGIDWVTRHHTTGTPAVANLSLSGPASNALDSAVSTSLADGITYAVAAGNDGGAVEDLSGLSNACSSSPARVPGALTVAATDRYDNRAPYSNIGRCVDLFAPGTRVISTWNSSDTAVNVLSGTSMATPHVAGVAALYLQAVPGAGAAEVAAAVTVASPGRVKAPGTGSPNRLLYSRF